MDNNKVDIDLQANENDKGEYAESTEMERKKEKNSSVPVVLHEDFQKSNEDDSIRAEEHKFPCCIVWTSLPLITALFPSIGHVGVCESNGIIHDFAGSRYVSINDMAFGWPLKYVKLDINQQEKYQWDKAVEKGEDQYNGEEYNFCTNNCHSFVAYVLNKYKYKERGNYTMLSIWWLCSTKSKYISWCALVKAYIWFLIIIIIILVLVYLFAIKKI